MPAMIPLLRLTDHSAVVTRSSLVLSVILPLSGHGNSGRTLFVTHGGVGEAVEYLTRASENIKAVYGSYLSGSNNIDRSTVITTMELIVDAVYSVMSMLKVSLKDSDARKSMGVSRCVDPLWFWVLFSNPKNERLVTRNLIKSSGDILCIALECLGASLRESSVMTQFWQDKDRMPYIITLLNNDCTTDVIKSAAWILGVCSETQPGASVVLAKDGLNALFKLSRTPGLDERALRFIQDAMDKIFNYNASAEYALQGVLSVNDSVLRTTCDGPFFDAGRLARYGMF